MSQPLIDAQELLKRGRRNAARALLRQYVARRPGDPAGWYLLSQAATDRAEGLYCLQRVLETAGAARVPPAAPVALPPRPASTPARRLLRGVAYALTFALVGLLAAALLPLLFGQRSLVVLSGSMAPAIRAGSTVVVGPVPSAQLNAGDVIAYLPEGAAIPVVHRLVRVREENGARVFVTRGDANGSDDPGEFTLPPTAWRVRYSVPLAGYLIAFASSRAGLFGLVGVPAAWLALLQVSEWIKTHRGAQWDRLLRRLASGGSLTRLGAAAAEGVMALWRAARLVWQPTRRALAAGRQRAPAIIQAARAGLRRRAAQTTRWASAALAPLSDASLTAAWHRLRTRQLSRLAAGWQRLRAEAFPARVRGLRGRAQGLARRGQSTWARWAFAPARSGGSQRP